MNRTDLLTQLQAYLPQAADELEASHVLKHLDFIRRTPKAFERDHDALGHVTGSALVASDDYQHVLLNQHGLSGVYINFGGHCDGEEDVFAVATRELAEEAGIENAKCDGQLFDVDVHFIPAHLRKGAAVPAHLHYDIRYLFTVSRNTAFTISEESQNIRWFTITEALALRSGRPDVDAELQRMLSKVLGRQA